MWLATSRPSVAVKGKGNGNGNQGRLLALKSKTGPINPISRAGSGDPKNRVAVLDPNASQADLVASGQQTMIEVLTIFDATPDALVCAIHNAVLFAMGK